MARFPNLRSGAVAQYPFQRHAEFATRVLEFADGTEQRFRRTPGEARRWVIRLELATSQEIDALEEFFRMHDGRLESFEFFDPATGELHKDCSFENALLTVAFGEEERVATRMVIRENK